MTPTRFEDRLLVELRAVVAERAAPPVAAAATPRRRRAAPRLVLSGAATAAVAAGALLVALGGDAATPAFAVEPHADGDVAVTIYRLSDAAGLESKLRSAGVPAVVDYTPPDKACREPRGAAPSGAGGKSSTVSRAKAAGGGMSSAPDGSTTFTIKRGSVRPDETLVLTTRRGADVSSVGIEIIEGAVAPCQLVDAPPAPTPGASEGSSAGADESPSSGTGAAKPQTQTVP
jgi:hypothetical protein